MPFCGGERDNTKVDGKHSEHKGSFQIFLHQCVLALNEFYVSVALSLMFLFMILKNVFISCLCKQSNIWHQLSIF